MKLMKEATVIMVRSTQLMRFKMVKDPYVIKVSFKELNEDPT
jgi:hypothetical protein